MHEENLNKQAKEYLRQRGFIIASDSDYFVKVLVGFALQVATQEPCDKENFDKCEHYYSQERGCKGCTKQFKAAE